MSERVEATVYFDGSCPICRTEIAHYRRQDAACQLQFIDVSKSQSPTPHGVTRQMAMQRFHVEMADGRLLSGAEAFVAIWAVLPQWRWLARLARPAGIAAVLEWAYRAFLPIRPIVSRIVRRVMRLSGAHDEEASLS